MLASGWTRDDEASLQKYTLNLQKYHLSAYTLIKARVHPKYVT